MKGKRGIFVKTVTFFSFFRSIGVSYFISLRLISNFKL